MPKPIDVATMTKPQLKALHENAVRLGREDVALEALRQLTLIGGARSADYALLAWNQEAARAALAPFVEVSRSVPDSQRTAYTEAGGRKIGRKRSDPEWMWVDCYTAIKRPGLNAEFICYVPQPGDAAFFRLTVNREIEAEFAPEELGVALDRWRELAATATRNG